MFIATPCRFDRSRIHHRCVDHGPTVAGCDSERNGDDATTLEVSTNVASSSHLPFPRKLRHHGYSLEQILEVALCLDDSLSVSGIHRALTLPPMTARLRWDGEHDAIILTHQDHMTIGD